MNLSLKQVADVFGVSEYAIIEWINHENLPAELVADQYRCHRTDLLEWASLQTRRFSPSVYSKLNVDLQPAAAHLADTLELGGVLRNVGGATLRDVLSQALEGLPIPDSFGIDTLLDLFLTREDLGSTAIGHGIGIPHPRHPVLLTVPSPVVRLCFLSKSLNMAAPDGRRVDKLFVIICPTAHDHLQLLARISAVLQVESVMMAIEEEADTCQLLAAIRESGRHFHDDLPVQQSYLMTATA